MNVAHKTLSLVFFKASFVNWMPRRFADAYLPPSLKLFLDKRNAVLVRLVFATIVTTSGGVGTL